MSRRERSITRHSLGNSSGERKYSQHNAESPENNDTPKCVISEAVTIVAEKLAQTLWFTTVHIRSELAESLLVYWKRRIRERFLSKSGLDDLVVVPCITSP